MVTRYIAICLYWINGRVAVQLLEPTAMAVQLLEPTAWRRAQRRSQSSSVVRPPRPLPPLKVGATLRVEGADYQTVKGPSPVGYRRVPPPQGHSL